MKTCLFEVCRAAGIALLGAAIGLQAHGVHGSDKGLAKNNNSAKIFVTADTLVTDNNAQTAEFIGNVSLSRGASTIRAGRIVIYYDSGLKNKKVEADRKQMVKKFIAYDNVRIDTERTVARADQAVYTRDEKTIELSGENVQVTQGNNSLAGTRITLYIESEDVRVASDEKQRVEAVFSPVPGSTP